MFCDVDRIRPDGKIAVLKRGDLETGDKRLLSLYKRGDDALNLQKDGKPVGQLLLINIKEMVPTESATVEVDLQADSLAYNLHLVHDANGPELLAAMKLLGAGAKWRDCRIFLARG